MEKNKILGSTKGQVLFFVITMCVISILFIIASKDASLKTKKKLIENGSISDDYSIFFDIDVDTKEDDNDEFIVHISGVDFAYEEVFLSLGESVNKKEIIISTVKLGSTVEDNEEILSYLASLKKNEKDDGRCYELFVSFLGSDINAKDKITTGIKKIKTGLYYYKGKIYNFNPENFFTPSFSDARMSDIVTNGCLCGFEKEYGMWIYIYDKEIFWIADRRFKLPNQNICIPYLVYTTEIDKLTPERQKFGYDNFDFFYDKEEKFYEDSDFYVVKKKIPQTYFVTYIVSGLFDIDKNEWIWKEKIPLRD